MRRVRIIPACFYAVGVVAALVLVALIALGFPAPGLHYGLAIVCLLLVAFISAAVAYARTQPPPRVTAITTRQEERTLVASMPYPGMSPRKEQTMEQSPMLSVPVAGGRQMEPLNWYFIAAACPVAVIVLYFLGGILPPSLLVLLFFYCLLLCPASLVIGIVESVRRRRGPNVHAVPQGMALYPSLIQVRVRRYSYTFGITAGPISLIAELALQVPIVHAIIHILCGFLLSAISFMLCVSNPWRPSCIHHGPFILFSPDHMEIHPLTDSSPTPIPWDMHPRIEGFTMEDYAFFPCVHMHVSVDGLEDSLVFDMTGAPMRFVLLRRLIDYFVDKPEERAKLGRPEGAQLVRSLLTAP